MSCEWESVKSSSESVIFFPLTVIYLEEILKVHGPIFQNSVSVSLEELSLQSCKFKIWVETVKLFDCTKQVCVLQLPISYCVTLIMVTITRHVFINIFQTECISAVKFDTGYEKNMSFLVIPYPNLQKFEKMLKK